MKTDSELHTVQLTAAHVAQDAAEAAAPPRIPLNLVRMADTVPGALSPTGNVTPHDTNRVTPFIRVKPGEPYVSYRTSGVHRVVWFDVNHTNISGTNTDNLGSGAVHPWTAPDNAWYARLGVAVSSTEDYRDVVMVFNAGDSLVNLEDPSEYQPSGYWDGRERPGIGAGEVTLEHLSFADQGGIAERYVHGAVPPRITNLIDFANLTPGTLSPTGNVVEHATNVVTGFLPVSSGTPYVSMHPVGQHRVVWFDTTRAAIAGTDTNYVTTGATASWVAPPGAAYARLGLNLGTGRTPEGAVFNQGDTLWTPNKGISTGWWDDRELPPGTGGGGNIDLDQLTELVESLLPQYEPSVPTLQFEAVTDGWQDPLWLSTDGHVLYGRQGGILLQSVDEWETTQEIHVFSGYSIQAARELADGELLIATGRDESIDRKAKLFRSAGYDRNNPTAATWSEVLEIGATQANINNSWGLQVYQNIVVAGEYGLRGENGARRVWLSEDHAQTFTLVFDQKTVDAPGRPDWTESGHVHTAAWDPYWSRLWVVVGDNPNTATYYSDDKGDTWTYVEGSGGPSPAVQYTGIMPLPDVVLFGSDRAPNGVFTYRRGDKSDMPVIKPLLLVDDQDVITRVFQLPYRRDWHPTTPTYFAATPANDREPSVIVGTVDGKKAHVLWEGAQPGSGATHSGRVRYAFGPTVQGNVIAVMEAEPGVTGRLTMRAPAPTWARA